METINLTEYKRPEFIDRDSIVLMLKKLPQDKPINTKTLQEYSKQKMICHPSTISDRFGTIKNACEQAGVRCDCIYDVTKKMNKINTIWNKENIIEALKNLEKKYGKIKAIDIYKYSKNGDICCADTIRIHFKTIIDAFEQAGIQHRKYYWSKDRIIKALQDLYNTHGEFSKSDLRHKFIKEGLICERVHIQKQFGSLDEAAEQAGINFRPVPNDGTFVGKYESDILDKIEDEKGIKLIRQFHIARSFVDGYDPINNVAYEIDEEHHRWQHIQDEIRQRKIENTLGCSFERIKLYL